MDESGRINLSIKAALPAPPAQQARPARTEAPRRSAPARPQYADRSQAAQPAGESSFEDKLKRFMADSDSKISGIKQYSDKKNARRRSGK